MTKYVIRRFLGLIPTLFIIVTFSFFIIRVAPGGPFDAEKALPQQVLENIEKKYHMDEPLLVQYGRYLLNILRGDLGPSFRYQDHDVNYYIFRSLPNSLLLGTISLGMAKVNVASEICRGFRDALAERWASDTTTWMPCTLADAVAALNPIVRRWCTLCGAEGKA